MTTHDEPNCDPTVDCKFVGPRDCLCRCHRVAGVGGDLPSDILAAGLRQDWNQRPSDEAIAEQRRMTEAYYADPDV